MLTFQVVGQPVYTLNDSTSVSTDQYEILPDRGYTFDQILANPSLPFSAEDSLRLAEIPVYWLRVKVNNPYGYARSYDVRVEPLMDNTLYNFDYNAGKWVGYRAGILTESKYNRRIQGIMPCVLQAKMVNTLYVRVEVSSLRKFGYVLKRKIQFNRKNSVLGKEENLRIAWMVAITVLFLFFLNNVYIYFSFRDKTVLYYLIAQLGGIIYITSYRHFFSLIFYCPVFTFWIKPSGWLDYYDLNYLLMHIGILGIMYGLVQFTRSFFDTKRTLPVLNTVLKRGLIVYVSITTVIILINSMVFYLEHYTRSFENLFALFLILIILSTCVAGYLRKLPAAGSFLLANMLPLVFMVGTTLFHVLVGVNDSDNTFLPDMAIIAQSLGFSIALVARTRLIQSDLKVKEMQARQLEFDLRELTLAQRLTEMENQKINAEILVEKSRNELLHHNLEANRRELASTTLYIVQKNKMLADLKKQIHESNQQFPDNKHQGLDGVKAILNSNLYLDSDWAKFKLHFEQVHPRFFEDLYVKHPSLTKNEIRIYAYFHMKLATKEIASLLNIDPASVRRAKTRLYKKMALPEDE
ncbi:7TM diverse intracellular signaling domain-containing protein [Dyadobacter sp. LHD-138]|uniref:7TM diverse intracellular signaling domain-containing protein n=1 Tax=Dyadobacter sp. LHD-138 TaxID=3071413 RepID=UPI0027DFED4D|nr:7TM diverse intracellular signaling domain-containing protein [Dyadobacter sp. LHD-138]MDQ6480585.1 7TM diverse intracellular signaling domain-containing protein [Dyadobacter sp. LHD-138]